MKPPGDELIEPESGMLTYDSYLKVSDLLKLQSPLSDPMEHDETLFIIIHQVYELWFKQILHELEFATKLIRDDQLIGFLQCLKRITTIQTVLTNQVDILETMTPTDFNRFRERLNPASGFQSAQFRILEFRLGMKHKEYLKYHRGNNANKALLEEAINKPSIYDEFLRYLHRRGYEIPEAVLKRDTTVAYTSNAEVQKVLLSIYQNPKAHYELYMAMEDLLDFDQKLLLWRYRHVAMVSRMIGNNKGTGGSSGVNYLTATLSKRCFPELWQVRDDLTAQSSPK